MKLDALKFGLASAISASVLWLICSLLVMLMPGRMLSMSGDMLHMQLDTMGWQLSLMGVVMGLFGWFVIAGLAGSLLAAVYNRLV